MCNSLIYITVITSFTPVLGRITAHGVILRFHQKMRCAYSNPWDNTSNVLGCHAVNNSNIQNEARALRHLDLRWLLSPDLNKCALWRTYRNVDDAIYRCSWVLKLHLYVPKLNHNNLNIFRHSPELADKDAVPCIFSHTTPRALICFTFSSEKRHRLSWFVYAISS